MTQVLNSYRTWPFSGIRVEVIVSRDGSRGLRAIALFLRALVRVGRLEDPSRNMLIVHLSQGGSFVREGMILRLARWRGFGVVAHLHGSRFVEYAQQNPRFVRWVLSAASRIVVLSDATQAAVARLVRAERVEIVPNAVPEGDPTAKGRVVVFGGAVGHRKGVDVLLAAWRRIQNHSGWTLELAGPVVEPDVVQDLPDGVVLLGPLAHGVLMSRLDAASIAVLPSRDEAMPMFILEAMARQNCVISTRVGGIPALLSDGAGLLVEAGDADALASAMDLAMKDDALRCVVAEKGFEVFRRRFSAEAVYPRIERLWLSVLTPARATES